MLEKLDPREPETQLFVAGLFVYIAVEGAVRKRYVTLLKKLIWR